jgi:hypothetical protein
MIIQVEADVKVSLYLIQQQAMKIKVQVEVQCHSFLNTALDGDVLQPLYSHDKKPMYPVDRKLCQPQRQTVDSAELVFLCSCV